MQLHLLEPRATEKSYLEQTNRTYVFPVDRTMSKQAIARLVEKEFNVTVTDVRTLTRKGKATKYSKGKHAYPGITHRQDKKFAYVRLKKGDFIKVFDDADEQKEEKHSLSSRVKAATSGAKHKDEPENEKKTSAKEAKKAEKEAKKADKNAGKENK
ncbi:50S ribosomal protein L23 [Candidatus Saccharibacteria bacterium]|nr:50S ribosomal protein L23 [Candidatus Saccharibacteria bacterium]